MDIYKAFIIEFDWDGNTIHLESYHSSKLNAYRHMKKSLLKIYYKHYDRYIKGGFNYDLYNNKVWRFENNKKYYVEKIEIID